MFSDNQSEIENDRDNQWEASTSMNKFSDIELCPPTHF
jgi:hypothetical protein